MTIVGIAVALRGLGPIPGVTVALVLAGFNLFLERSVFHFAYMHFTPMPDFEWDPEQWEAMAYQFEGEPPDGVPIGIAFVFRTAAYARSFFGLLRSWNDNESDDPNNNICLSFITDEELYYALLYPNTKREAVRRSWKSLRRAAKRRGPTKEPFLLVVQVVICKDFSTMVGYALGDFVERYKPGEPFDLLAFELAGHSGPRPVEGVPPIRKYHLRAKARVDLRPDEFEYVHLAKLGV